MGGFALIIAIVFLIITPDSANEKVAKYFVNKLGFKDTGGSSLYSKQNSKIDCDEYEEIISNNLDAEYEFVYFNIDSYELTMINMIYSNGITKDFTPVYNYTNNKLTYTYRITYNTANAIIEGSFDYKKNEFVVFPLVLIILI